MEKRQGFQVATIAGLPIRIDPSWFLIVALLSWTLATGYFPQAILGLGAALYWLLGVMAALLLFASVLLHEIGHAMVARREGQPVHGITLFLFGGVSELSAEPATPGAELRITLGGWLISAGLALVCYGVYRLVPGTATISVMAMALFQYLALVNTVLFVFNGLPGFPLDGGRLLRALLWKLTGNVRKATAVASQVGAAIGIMLIVLGAFALVGGALVGGIWLGLIGLFLHHGARNGYQQMMIRRALAGVPVRELMNRQVVTMPANINLDEAVRDYFLRHHYHSFPVLDQQARLVGMISLHEIKSVDEPNWPRLAVGELVRQQNAAELNTVAPDTDVIDALRVMAQSGQGRLAVVADQQLVGVLTRREILHFLAVKTDLLADAA